MGTTLSLSDPPRPTNPALSDPPLPDDPVLLQGMIRELLAALQSERHHREHLEQRLDQLLRRLYGPRSEKIVGPTLFDAVTPPAAETPLPALPPEPVAEPAPTAKSKRGHGRRRLPENLPRQRIVHDLSEAEKLCPCCQSPRVRFGEDLSERLDYVPASLYIVEHARPKYVCRQCAGQVAQAELPPEPIDKGIPGAGLLAEIIVNKFVDHQPLHRQQQKFQRQGVDIHRSTMGDWLGQCAHLLEPIYALMVTAVLQSKVIHTDDTPVRLLQDGEGETRTGRLWVYWGDEGHPYTVYEATASRSRDGPKKFLAGFKGHLQADAFSGYDCVFDAGVIEVACWAHARRKFIEAQTTAAGPASEALARIRALYDVEARAKEMTAAERLALRQAESAPLLKSFGEWIEQARLQALPKSPLAEALGYVRNQWQALNVYLTDGDLSIDNNIAERALRGTAIGRKNWLFFGSETGGRTAAILTSFTATCRRLGINPWLYLKDVLSRIRTCPAEQLPTLLPDAWAKAQAESIAADKSN
jgi:transposase